MHSRDFTVSAMVRARREWENCWCSCLAMCVTYVPHDQPMILCLMASCGYKYSLLRLVDHLTSIVWSIVSQPIAEMVASATRNIWCRKWIYPQLCHHSQYLYRQSLLINLHVYRPLTLTTSLSLWLWYCTLCENCGRGNDSASPSLSQTLCLSLAPAVSEWRNDAVYIILSLSIISGTP